MMDKREMIISVLAPFTRTADLGGHNDLYFNFDALAKQAIVIECEVEHKAICGDDITALVCKLPHRYNNWCICGLNHIGTPGKALAIIVPLGEEVTEDIDWLDGEDYGAK